MKQRLQVRAAGSHAGQKQACECENNANVTEHAAPSIGTDAATEILKRAQCEIKKYVGFSLAVIDWRLGDYADRNPSV